MAAALAAASCSNRAEPQPGDDLAARVVAHVRAKLENHHPSAEITAERVAEPLLEGLERFEVSVLVPDHMGHRCLVVKAALIVCSGEGDAFERTIRALELGANRDRLDDAQWLELYRFASGGVLVRDASDARRLVRTVPPEVAAKIGSPQVEHPAVGGVVLRATQLLIRNDAGPYGFRSVMVTVASDGTVTEKQVSIWEDPR